MHLSSTTALCNVALLGTALVLCACAEPAIEQDHPGFMGASPPDGTTGLIDLTVEFGISRPGRPLSEVERSNFAEGLSLATWPDLLPVSSTVTVHPAPPIGPATPDTFVVVPESPQNEGWYVALVERNPPDVTWAYSYDHLPTDGGAGGVRLRIGSEPSVWSIDFCAKGPTTYVVYVTFSEAISDLNAVNVPSVSVQSEGQTCAAMGGSNAAPNSRRGFLCDLINDAETFTIRVDDGLESPQGIAVPPGTYAVSPAALGLAASGCRIYKVTR